MSCRDRAESLEAFLDGELDGAEERELREHLRFCGDCLREAGERRGWHRSLQEALASGPPPEAEYRRLVQRLASRRVPAGRIAALLAIGLSVGIVATAVAFSRPPEAQVARVVERLKERESRDAALRAIDREIQVDLQEARRKLESRGAADPAAGAVAVASWAIEERLAVPAEAPVAVLVADSAAPEPDRRASARAALRRLGPDRLDELIRAPGGDRRFVSRLIGDLQARRHPGDRLSISRSVDGETVSLTQKHDGRVVVKAGALLVEARNMAELLARHAALCARYAIGGVDGFVTLGDQAAGADLPGRVDFLFRTGTWDDALLGDPARRPPPGPAAREFPVDAEAIRRRVLTLSRAELQKTLEGADAELRALEDRLKEAAELRQKARGLRVFAEDATRK